MRSSAACPVDIRSDGIVYPYTRYPPLTLAQVCVNDLFWSPKLKVWNAKTVYGLEVIDNPNLNDLTLSANALLTLPYKPDWLNGVNVITGQELENKAKAVTFTAIPFYAVGSPTAFFAK